MSNIIKILGKQGCINEIDPYDWFQWHFRHWSGRRLKDGKRQTNRLEKM